MEYKENDFETSEPLDGSAYDKPETDDLADETQSPAYETEYDDEPPVKAGKYRILSLIVFVLTAGGLFLGLLGNGISWFAPSYYRSGLSGINNSLLGFFLDHMRQLGNLSTVMSGPVSSIIRHAFAISAAFLILFTLIITLVSFILTFALPKKAKTATAIGGAVGLFAYTALFLWACCIKSIYMSTFGAAAIDVPVALIMLALFVVMTVDAILSDGVQGLLSAGIYVFTVAACFAFFFPGSFTESHLPLLETFSAHPAYNVVVLMTLAFILLNFLLSVIALAGKWRGVMQVVLSSIQLFFVLVLAIAACIVEKSAAFFVEGALLPSIVLIISSLGALLLAIIVLILKRNAAQAAYEAYYNSYDETDDDEEHETDEGHHEMTAWEREMLSLAENGAEAPAETQEPQPPYPPYPPYPYDRQTAAPSPRPFTYYTDPSTQYVYDPFINELTPEEKNEFGDLFIACKAGKYGDLPEYHIGGDNREFFDKVWIRYGLYEMSPGLRDKLFNYLRKYRKK